MNSVRLILVGGFLGAGKTTLLAQTARRLAAQGKRVGLVTNDQASNLVDTAVLSAEGFAVREVSGGCFCCRFQDLVSAADTLIEQMRPDVLVGEPVGSCTDLSATVIQPLKKLLGDRFCVAPFSVLADPTRLAQSQPGHARIPFPHNVLYIFRKQLEEADLVVLNKADTLTPDELQRFRDRLDEQLPGKPLLAMSALTGQGVDQWLEYVSRDLPAGKKVVEVDYDEYAAGEAALGWLNAAVHLRSAEGTDWRAFCQRLMECLQGQLRALGAEIAHLKIRLTAGAESLAANLTGSDERPQVRGAIRGAPAEALLLLNARAHLDPERLKSVVQQSLAQAAGDRIQLATDDLRSFAPGRPQPTHRFTSVVDP